MVAAVAAPTTLSGMTVASPGAGSAFRYDPRGLAMAAPIR